MIERIVAALNSITTQAWAFLILLIGVGACVWFHKAGLEIGIAAGIIGTALNMFQGQSKPATPTSPQPINSPTVPPETPPTTPAVTPKE